MAKGTKGKVVQVIGTVVDVEFPPDDLPEIYDAVEIDSGGENKLVAEVEQHLGNNWVRCLAMDTTDGLRRGAEAEDTGAPIQVPVGEPTLGRMFNVLGDPIDGREEAKSDEHWPIHRTPPTFEERETTPQVLETGVKVLDLVSPFTKGGKVGAYGGAGTG
ncbi:MAG: F0F1 ATP synthase subunit beta, partial [Dehalococcoidia bacterium]